MSAEDRVVYWQRRAHLAEHQLQWEKEEHDHLLSWFSQRISEEHRLRDRCVELYGLAARHGATDDELHHGWTGYPEEVAS